MDNTAKVVGKKLLELRKINGFTQQFVADYCSVGKSTVSTWENGFAVPSTPNISKLCELFNVSRDYLFMEDINLTELNNGNDAMPIPILKDLEVDDNILSNTKTIGYAFERQNDLAVNSHNYFFIKVADNSMTGAKLNKDDIALVRTKKALEHGDIGVLFVNGELLIRRVLKTDGRLLLQGESFGKIVEPIVLKKNMKTKILGKVLKVRSTIGEDD